MNSRSLQLRHELETLCDEFESRWSTHSVDLIREVANEAGAENHDLVLEELIRIDCELSARAGKPIASDIYIHAFPDLHLALTDLPRDPLQHETQAFSDSVADHASLPPMPVRVGGYSIEEKIGSGGMGVVYRAVDAKLNRTVAIKMMTCPLDEMVPRFKSEAAMIAGLNHPGVVKIFETGTHEGRPYLVLEYVSGGNLNDRIKATRLSSRKAVDMALKIAEAIQAAHSIGVIHRDLKPANVLLDENNQPKLADFGLARQEGSERHTLSGNLLGTPGFMAPEQTTSATPTTAVDVYGFGGILYACLTGLPPFKGDSIPETLRMVCEKEVKAPKALRPEIELDLNSICLKCLQKDPARRYSSIVEVAADLRAFRDHRAVMARPPGAQERVFRWCRRNPWIAVLSSVLVIAVLAGGAGSFLQWQRANEEVVATRSVVGFLQEVFDITNGAGRDGTVRQSIYESLDRIDDAFTGRPELEITVRQTLGDALRSMEDFEESEKQYRLALSLSKEVHGDVALPTLEVMDRLAGTLRNSDDEELLPEAAALRKIVATERQRKLGASHPDTVTAMNNLATVYLNQKKFSEAETIYKNALDILNKSPNANPQDSQMIRFNLVLIQIDNDELVEAEESLRQILHEMDDADVSRNNIDRLKAMSELADVIHELGRPNEALQICRVLLPRRQFMLGTDSSRSLSTHRRTIRLLIELHEFDEAWNLLQLCLEIHNIKFGRDAGLTLGVRESMVKTLIGLNRRDEAISFQKETVNIVEKGRGPEHQYSRKARAVLDEME